MQGLTEANHTIILEAPPPPPPPFFPPPPLQCHVIQLKGCFYKHIVVTLLDDKANSRCDFLHREEQLLALQSGKEYDVLVIGGGATGCGIALDSTLRGVCVCVV